MKILIYAFSAFGNNAKNISEQVLKSLPELPGLHKHVFATRFNSKQFIDQADKLKPDLIIGLGQYPNGDKLRIETIAKNEYASKSNPQVKSISPMGPLDFPVTYQLPETAITVKTQDAGRYVCNYSMYVLGTWAKKNNSRFCFLHIPKTFSRDLAVSYLSPILRKPVIMK